MIAEEEIVIEEAIAKAIADAKNMITKAIEDSEVAQTNTPKEWLYIFPSFCTWAWSQFCIDFLISTKIFAFPYTFALFDYVCNEWLNN